MSQIIQTIKSSTVINKFGNPDKSGYESNVTSVSSESNSFDQSNNYIDSMFLSGDVRVSE